MSTMIAQATIPNNGASNAAEFQPGTQNPQNAPGPSISPVQDEQAGNQSQLLNSQATIQVPDYPDSAGVAAKPAAGGSDLWLWLLIGLVLAIGFVWWRRRQPAALPAEDIEPQELDAPEAAIEALATEKPKPAAPKPKKSAPKKSKSQRKKRARR